MNVNLSRGNYSRGLENGQIHNEMHSELGCDNTSRKTQKGLEKTCVRITKTTEEDRESSDCTFILAKAEKHKRRHTYRLVNRVLNGLPGIDFR